MTFPKLKPLTKSIADKTSGRLELVAQYKLNGTIATMGVVKTTSPRGREGCDSLLLGFSDAKVYKYINIQIHKYRKLCLEIILDVIIRMVTSNKFNCDSINSLL